MREFVLQILENIFALILFSNTIAGVVICIIALPMTGSIIWGTWFIALIGVLVVHVKLVNTIEEGRPAAVTQSTREIALQTIVVQQPDGSLNLTNK